MSFVRRNIGLITLVCFALIVVSAGSAIEIDSESPIHITKVDNGTVFGNVSNIDPALYQIIVFIQNDGKWWGPKPIKTTIDDIKHSWEYTYAADSSDTNDSAIRVYLVPEYLLSRIVNTTGESEVQTDGWEFLGTDEIEIPLSHSS